MKHISLLCVLFLIVGCVNQGSHSFDKQSIDTKTKGLVVMKSTGSLNGSSEFLVAAAWLNTDTHNLFYTRGPYKRHLRVPDNPKTYYIYMLEPGHYTLNEVSFLEPSTVNPGFYSFYGIKDFAYFEVKGGDVLYLGDCYQQYKDRGDMTHNVKPKINLNDRFDEAKAFMNENYPSLAGKLEKRLIKRYGHN
ncbi:MAG: hypothetical protein V4482_03895 [Pseudomonadota bacterium]